MNRNAEIETSVRNIKNAEIRLNTISTRLEMLSKEIETLDSLENSLEQNFKYLKKNKVVALAFEYKKVKNDLARIRNLMVFTKNERENAKKDFRETEKTLNACRISHDKLLKSFEKNIIKGKFGKNNG